MTRTSRPLLEATVDEIDGMLKKPASKACSRPGLYEYLRLNHQFSGLPIDELCPLFSLLSERGEFLELPFARLEQAQYMIAGRGDGMASHFGHALIRLTFCKPGESSPCQPDDFYAVDVGFAAQTQNFKFSALGGITGRYPSLLAVSADSDLRARYTHDELRSLHAYPLKLSREQLRLLWVLVVEKFWIHSASYKFLSNNCADEVLNLLVSILPDEPKLNQISRALLSPSGLLESLRRLGWIEGEELVWDSQRQLLEHQLVRIIGPTRQVVGNLKTYQKESALNRHAWIALLSDPYDRQIMARFEEITAKALAVKTTQTAVKNLYAESVLPSCNLTQLELIERLEQNSRAITPQYLKQSQAGAVPLHDEMPSAEEILERRKRLNQNLNQIVECYKNQPEVQHDLVEARMAAQNLIELRR